jgi:hypothetical protein
MIACGIPSFTKFIRDDVWHSTSRDNIIEFVEVEYRPHGSHDYPRSKYLSEQKRDIELRNLNSHEPPRQPELVRNVLSKAAVSQRTHMDENFESAVGVDAVQFV